MAKRHPVTLVFSVACALLWTSWTATAQDKVDLTGKWEAQVDLGDQQGTPSFELKQEGEKLSGKYQGQFGESNVTGTVKGKDVEFSFEAQMLKVVYTGTIENGALKGKVNYGDALSGTWTAKRAAAAAANLTGTWNGKVDAGGQQGTPTFELKQDGEKVTGKYKGQFGEADVTGTIKGKDVEFSFDLGGMLKVVYKGTLEGNAMKGTVEYGDQASGTWTAEKAPAS